MSEETRVGVVELEEGTRELQILLSADLVDSLTEGHGATWSFDGGLDGLDIDGLYVGTVSSETEGSP